MGNCRYVPSSVFLMATTPLPVKVFEVEDAIRNGAEEVDMVINIGWAKDGLFEKIEEEIRALKKAAGSHILKVIIETGLLTDEEKVALCKAVTNAGADFIKDMHWICCR